ncbi:MAG: shikimate kinase [Candidatus Marinimicrobia bacterium]|nr:shikimate kinase [Candidatus Neomarinimicrobiota bacterium]
MLIDENIFLIGMMNSGKTTVGKILSKKIKYNFIDTDIQIEEIMSISISDIFDIFGEKRFREMESSFFIEKSKEKGIVFSTGGGIVLNDLNANSLKNNGITILLEASIEQLAARIKVNNKPLLINSSNFKRDLSKLWQERKKLYYNYADIIINNDNLSPIGTVQEIIKVLNENHKFKS